MFLENDYVAIDILHSQLSLSSQKTMQKVIFSIVILATFNFYYWRFKTSLF